VNISRFIANYFVFLAILLTSIVPLSASANVFSFLFNTANAQSTVEAPVQNSQNMPLLQATVSPDPAALSATSTVAIVDETSLVSEPPISKDANTVGDETTLYVVHSGDTLPAIAQMFGVSVNTIVWANNIKGGKVSVGDKLIILPVSGVQYTVKKGDTLQKIATTYKGDLDTIAQFNNLSSDTKLAVGDVIIIPDGQVSASESGPVVHSSGGTNGGSNGIVHVGPGGTSPLASGALPPPGGAPVVGAVGSESPTIIGYFERPILGGVKTQGIHGHNGIDLSSSIGTPIRAAADGEVIIAKSGGWNGGYGSYIEIQHPNGTQTLYAHLSKVSVSVGDNVTQGQVIGKLGDTGDSTGPHVHFEIHGAQNPF